MFAIATANGTVCTIELYLYLHDSCVFVCLGVCFYVYYVYTGLCAWNTTDDDDDDVLANLPNACAFPILSLVESARPGYLHACTPSTG